MKPAPTLLCLAFSAAIALPGAAAAQAWPARPITLVVPFAPGGGIDASARIQAQHIGELLGQAIVVENIGAAAGMAGSARVAKAAPDGYTLLIGNSGTHAYNQSLYKKPLYDAAAVWFSLWGKFTRQPTDSRSATSTARPASTASSASVRYVSFASARWRS